MRNAGVADETTAPAESALRSRRELRWLAIAVVCIAMLKLGFVLALVSGFRDQINPLYSIGHVDNYYSLAKNISHGRGYRFTPDTTLTLMREPGYPYFLAVLVHEFEDYNRAAVIANLLLTSLTALLIFKLARLLTSIAWVPVVAPILYMLHPGVVVAELRSGVEVPFTFLLLIFLILLRSAVCSNSWSAYMKAGIALGFTTYVRSTALLFPAFLVVYGLLFHPDWRSILRYAARAALVLACALLVLSPWIVRNYMLVGKFVPTASVQGVAMQVGNYLCVHADGKKEFVDLDNEAAEARKKLAAEQGYKFQGDYYQLFYDPHDEVKFNSFLGAQVVQQYMHSPATFVKCASENVFNFWFQGKNRSTTMANIAVQSFYLILALAGIFLGFREMHKPTLWLMLLFVLYTMAVYVPIHAQARYSIPIMPILSILAAISICKLLGRVARRGAAGASDPPLARASTAG
jgi:4-amino-4-deoxy-L-arabinose transferase-like glycosyltransferase